MPTSSSSPDNCRAESRSPSHLQIGTCHLEFVTLLATGVTMFRLDGKSAIVTGAGSGIGREIAMVYARQGASVWIADVNVAGAEAVAAEITAEGGKASSQALDVTDLVSARAAVAAVVSA